MVGLKTDSSLSKVRLLVVPSEVYWSLQSDNYVIFMMQRQSGTLKSSSYRVQSDLCRIFVNLS